MSGIESWYAPSNAATHLHFPYSSYRTSLQSEDGEWTPRYPLSVVRDEPRGPPGHTESPVASTSAGTRPQAELRPSPPGPIRVHKEVVPGCLPDGTLTVGHPYVVRYAAYLGLAYRQELMGSVAGPSVPRPLAHNAGIPALGKAEDVPHVLQLDHALTTLQCECVLALAALRVYLNAHDPAHFALWGKRVQKRTAEVVQRIYYHEPTVIASPVTWLGIRENTWLLQGIQAAAFPALPKEKNPSRMTLRQRKAGNTAQAQAATPATPARTRAQQAAVATASEGKGKAVARPATEAAAVRPLPRRARVITVTPRQPPSPPNADGVPISVAATLSVPLEESTERLGTSIVRVAPGVLLANADRVMEPAADGIDVDIETADGAPADTTMFMSMAVSLPIAPAATRRSSRQAKRRELASESSTPARLTNPLPSSATVTPSAVTITLPARLTPSASMPSRGSSTAVSSASDETAVGEERAVPLPRAAAGKSRKRKAAEMEPAGEVEAGAEEMGEEAPPRKTQRVRRPTAKTRDASATTPAKPAAGTSRKRKSGSKAHR